MNILLYMHVEISDRKKIGSVDDQNMKSKPTVRVKCSAPKIIIYIL